MRKTINLQESFGFTELDSNQASYVMSLINFPGLEEVEVSAGIHSLGQGQNRRLCLVYFFRAQKGRGQIMFTNNGNMSIRIEGRRVVSPEWTFADLDKVDPFHDWEGQAREMRCLFALWLARDKDFIKEVTAFWEKLDFTLGRQIPLNAVEPVLSS